MMKFNTSKTKVLKNIPLVPPGYSGFQLNRRNLKIALYKFSHPPT